MAAVKIGTRKVELPAVPLQEFGPTVTEGVRPAPFVEVAVDTLPCQRPIREQGTHGQLVPLDTGLELVEDRLDDLDQRDRR